MHKLSVQEEEGDLSTRSLLGLGAAIRALRSGGFHSQELEIVHAGEQTGDDVTKMTSSGTGINEGKELPTVASGYIPTPTTIINPSQAIIQLLRGLSNSAMLSLIHLETNIEPEDVIRSGLMQYLVKQSITASNIKPETHDPNDKFLSEMLDHYKTLLSSTKEPPLRFKSIVDLMAGVSESTAAISTDPNGLLAGKIAPLNKPTAEYAARLENMFKVFHVHAQKLKANFDTFTAERGSNKAQLYNHWFALTYPVLPLYFLGNLIFESDYLNTGVIMQSGDNGNSAGPFQINKIHWDDKDNSWDKLVSRGTGFSKLSKDIYKKVSYADFMSNNSDLDMHARYFIMYYIKYLVRKGDPAYPDKKTMKWNDFATAFIDVKAAGSESLDYGLWSFKDQKLIEFAHLGNPMFDALFEMFLHYVASGTDLSNINQKDGVWNSKWVDTAYNSESGRPRWIGMAIKKTLLAGFSIIFIDMIKTYQLGATPNSNLQGFQNIANDLVKYIPASFGK